MAKVKRAPEPAADEDEDDGEQAVDNKLLLWIAMISFTLFAIAELVASLLSHSEALLGDALTMMVDGITYGVNLWADRAKEGKTARQQIWIDIVAPGVSILALLIVTVYVTVAAVSELNGSTPTLAGGAVDPTVMWAFAAVNLVLDAVNLALFLVKKRDDGSWYLSFSACTGSSSCTCRSTNPDVAGATTDLNMLSALAHIGADTLRSVSVMIAGILADTGVVSSTKADAVGGIMVSIAIVLSVLPLLAEMKGRFKALRDSESTSRYRDLLLDNDAWVDDADGHDDDVLFARRT